MAAFTDGSASWMTSCRSPRPVMRLRMLSSMSWRACLWWPAGGAGEHGSALGLAGPLGDGPSDDHRLDLKMLTTVGKPGQQVVPVHHDHVAVHTIRVRWAAEELLPGAHRDPAQRPVRVLHGDDKVCPARAGVVPRGISLPGINGRALIGDRGDERLAAAVHRGAAGLPVGGKALGVPMRS